MRRLGYAGSGIPSGARERRVPQVTAMKAVLEVHASADSCRGARGFAVHVGFSLLGIGKFAAHTLAALVSIPACWMAYYGYVRLIEKACGHGARHPGSALAELEGVAHVDRRGPVFEHYRCAGRSGNVPDQGHGLGIGPRGALGAGPRRRRYRGDRLPGCVFSPVRGLPRHAAGLADLGHDVPV